MIRFEVLGGDKEDLKSKIQVNLEQDKDDVENWKEISKGLSAIIDLLPEPKLGASISARITMDLKTGNVDIDLNTYSSTMFGPCCY